jgi:hypothetical protein
MYLPRQKPKSQYEQFTDRAPQRLESGYYDQDQADRLYGQASAPIDEALYGTSRALAQSYADRGLDSSGLSAASQGDVALKAAAAKRLAKMGSIDAAQGDYQEGAQSAWGILSGDRGMDQTDEQLRRMQQQQDQAALQASMAGVGNLAGLFLF